MIYILQTAIQLQPFVKIFGVKVKSFEIASVEIFEMSTANQFNIFGGSDINLDTTQHLVKKK